MYSQMCIVNNIILCTWGGPLLLTVGPVNVYWCVYYLYGLYCVASFQTQKQGIVDPMLSIWGQQMFVNEDTDQ